jgi:hypothetical protein
VKAIYTIDSICLHCKAIHSSSYFFCTEQLGEVLKIKKAGGSVAKFNLLDYLLSEKKGGFIWEF